MDGPALCTPHPLPPPLVLPAAAVAVTVNPVNAPPRVLGAMTPLRIAVLTSRYWGPATRTLSVSFMEAIPLELRRRILYHLNAWSASAAFRFAYTAGVGRVRISRGPDGYWSYLGTDVLLIPRDQATMNLDGFTMGTPDREFVRVIRHEAGHTLGFPHEHMRRELIGRIDPSKAYRYFARTQSWGRQMVDAQVLTPLEEVELIATAPDQMSIMSYQLPGTITYDGQPIIGGVDIDATDYDFAARIYPRSMVRAHAVIASVDRVLTTR